MEGLKDLIVDLLLDFTPLIYEFELNRGSSIIKLNTVTVSSATTGGANGTDADYRYPFRPETGETWHIYTAPVSRAEENRATATATVSAAEQFLQSPLLLLVLDIQVNNHLSLLSHLHKQIMNRLIMYLMKVILVLLVELKPLL